MLRFIELKTHQNDKGPAWIGHVQVSRSGRTVYFNGKAFKRCKGGSGNHFDVENGQEYWISGIKKNGQDRHWAGSGRITIEASVVDEYLRIVGAKELDHSRFVISHKIEPSNPATFYANEDTLG